MKRYYLYNVKKAISVTSLITIEYLDIKPDFNYPEEEHTFHEFVYVDNGKIGCILNDKNITLSEHDFLLIPPNTTHNYEAVNGKNNTSVFIICFSSSSQALTLIDRVINFGQEEINLMSAIFNESKNAFVFPFNKKIEQIKNPLFGAQQIVEHYIEILLIHLIRNRLNANQDSIKVIINDEKLDNIIVENIINYLKNNVYGKINLADVSGTSFYTKTYLNKIFKKNMGKPIMQYYNFLKIEEAKRLLKHESISTVSNMLCFDNGNYFSKVFFKYTGKTPSQFKNGIQRFPI